MPRTPRRFAVLLAATLVSVGCFEEPVRESVHLHLVRWRPAPGPPPDPSAVLVLAEEEAR